ncbi:Transposon Ty3-I Gag-Pol polyprotein [Gossypium australe]|uniref:Transposon Ty3-I Gag-Pol polyprotein n=1 Tax=Gossypium australe TaxID=47621 RepID=A0A5B6UYZ3_9ROSI|nr:Transposon Ty3-I Gag-Pol polyprotein [Gossypium australe]
MSYKLRYLIGVKDIVYTDYSTIKCLVTKKDAKPRKGAKNEVVDHLSMFRIVTILSWYADIVNFLVSGLLPLELTSQRRRKFLHDAKQYYWDEFFLFKQYAYQIVNRCVPDDEIQRILQHCHSTPYE